jgi:hypothetical protein
MSTDANAGPEVDPAALVKLFERGEHEALCDELVRVLRYFEAHSFNDVGPGNQAFFDTFMELFLTLMAQERLVIPVRLAGPLVGLNQTIANLAAISKFGTTDACVERLLMQDNNLVKLLALLSARNRIEVDRPAIFDAAGDLASRWYGEYAGMFRQVASADVSENLRKHFHFQHPKLVASVKVAQVQYGSTYVGGDCDRAIKPVMNRSLQGWFGELGVVVRNSPRREKIAVLSGMWREGHSIHRIHTGFLEALRARHELTLLHLGTGAEPDTALFERVVRLPRVTSAADIQVLQDNEFGMAIYPEVGMLPETTVLSNVRIAPIQVCLLGHSVSTYGSLLDYFVSGSACEVRERPERNYSERLVLLPGMGVVHEKPTYVPTGRQRRDKAVVINCPWTIQKINHRLLAALARMVQGVQETVRFRIYAGGTTMGQSDHLPLWRELAKVLRPDRFELLGDLSYELYMRLMEEGDFTLDAFHFGGCNTVSDSLYLRLPTICWEGDKWYNRIGPEMLRRVGLAECVVRDEESYIALARRMITDGAWRAELRARLETADLDAAIYGREEGTHFATAMEYLLDHHGRLQAEGGREPIRIGKAGIAGNGPLSG